MRHLPLALLLGSTLLASAIASATSTTTIPAAAVKTAEQLRDQALHDDTGYRIVESLTTEVGPRMAGSAGDQQDRRVRGLTEGLNAQLDPVGRHSGRLRPAHTPLCRHGPVKTRLPERTHRSGSAQG